MSVKLKVQSADKATDFIQVIFEENKLALNLGKRKINNEVYEF